MLMCGELPPSRYQIFAPILALQLVNTFWSYLIWRWVVSLTSFLPTFTDPSLETGSSGA